MATEGSSITTMAWGSSRISSGQGRICRWDLWATTIKRLSLGERRRSTRTETQFHLLKRSGRSLILFQVLSSRRRRREEIRRNRKGMKTRIHVLYVWMICKRAKW